MTTAPLLLCTDLDRTLLPNGRQSESPLARRRFTALVSHEQIILTYVTGRDRGLVERAISSYTLPQPDFVISDVGTNIYDLRTGHWQAWDKWQREIAEGWKGYDHSQLRQMLLDFKELRLQEQKKQNTFKLSYYFPLYADRQTLNQLLTARLEESGIDASLVWSVDEPAGIGLLDILPSQATKVHALEFLQCTLGAPLNNILFSGDSGNDLPVLTSHIPSVLVANAPPSVVKEALSVASEKGNHEALYLAKGEFFGMNGNYSAGILEGVAHYHPELIPLFIEDSGINITTAAPKVPHNEQSG